MIGEIICVGTELLLGDILNTNAQYLSRKMAEHGVSVYYQTVVGDNEERLASCLELAKTRSDVVILSGGLGPTSDDITKEVTAKVTKSPLVLNEEILVKIKSFFEKIKLHMPENNKKQAYIPEGAILLDNANGTAPGIRIDKEETVYFLLPGPPRELIPMFETYVEPFLREQAPDILLSRTLRLIGDGESSIASKIQDILDHQTNPTVAPYAKQSEVHLRITAKAVDEVVANQMIDGMQDKICERVGKYIFTTKDQTLEEVIVEKLMKDGQTIATAESITGGLIASTLVGCSGVSSVFNEAIVTYSNEAKIRQLGVKEETLKAYGAVSEQTAKEMAIGICKKTGASIGISVTGIAGPSGGSKEKPVGLVYTGLSINGQVFVKKSELTGNRDRIRTGTTKKALVYLYEKLFDLDFGR